MPVTQLPSVSSIHPVLWPCIVFRILEFLGYLGAGLVGLVGLSLQWNPTESWLVLAGVFFRVSTRPLTPGTGDEQPHIGDLPHKDSFLSHHTSAKSQTGQLVRSIKVKRSDFLEIKFCVHSFPEVFRALYACQSRCAMGTF